MNNNNSQKKLLFCLLIPTILCLNPAVTGETKTGLETQESEEFENALVKNVRNDYRNGFVEIVKFINSMNDTLADLSAGFAIQASTLNDKIDALNITLSAQAIQLTALNAEVAGLTTRTNILTKVATIPNSLTWKEFDGLMKTQAKEMKTGKSFNGLTLSDIKSRAAQVGYDGWHTAIVFVNHLDEAISDFKIHQESNNFLYTPAPNSVPGRTKEVFIFATPRSEYRGGAYTSFSYAIPSFGIRVAAISYHGTYGVGLAFLPKGADMKTYYESRKGIEGSTVWEEGGYMDRNLSVGYKNLYARMFADYEGIHISTLRIELIKLPLDE